MKNPRRTSPWLQQTVLLSSPLDRADGPPNLLLHLKPATRASVLALGRTRHYQAGEPLFRQGDLHDGIHLIEAGMIKSFYVSEDGRELTLGYWSEGHYVGAPQVFGGGRHAWTSVAMAKARCLWLPGPPLRALSERHGDLALALVDVLVHKTQCYCALLQLLATHSMRVRLARLLVMLASRAGHAGVIDLSHAELAGMIGSTRQWVSISLSRLEEARILQRLPDSTYLVQDEAALRAVR
jgi:CRP/FNR family cyclic AMP-dependent transcriptional regulator